MTISKRSLKHARKISNVVKTWQLLVICIIFAGITVVGLRSNNATMAKLRSELIQADEQGKSVEEIEAKLQALRSYVTSHMNTNLRAGDLAIKDAPIQLVGLYNQAVTEEKERVSRANESLYTVAQAECEKQFPVGLSGSGRIPCIEQYVNEYGEKVRDVPREAFMFDFISPRWSPDVAGIFLVLTIGLSLITALKFLTERLIVWYLKSTI